MSAEEEKQDTTPKRPVGRPRNPNSIAGVGSKTIALRLQPDDVLKLEMMAHAQGKKRGEFLRDLVLAAIND